MGRGTGEGGGMAQWIVRSATCSRVSNSLPRPNGLYIKPATSVPECVLVLSPPSPPIPTPSADPSPRHPPSARGRHDSLYGGKQRVRENSIKRGSDSIDGQMAAA